MMALLICFAMKRTNKVMTFSLKRANQVHIILVLRCVAIVIQLKLIFFVNLVLNYQLPWTPLFSVIALEVLFTLVSFYFLSKGDVDTQINRHQVSRNKAKEKKLILGQIIADIIFLSLLLYFSGGATNAFVSLLLIPIAIAAVTLNPLLLGIVAGLAIASYSLLLWLLPMSVMHGNMEGHFIGMWINFLFSTIVVALVVGKMARSINQRELAIAAYQQELLKQEQVISLGVASAQVTHQLATPIATVQLLIEELIEEQPNNEIVNDMQTQLLRCCDSLSTFRKMTFDIKEQKSTNTLCQQVIHQIRDNIALNYPQITMHIKVSEASKLKIDHQQAMVRVDASLLPALLNLLNNAIRATTANNSQVIELSSDIIADCWQLSIRDFGQGFTLSKLKELGVKPVDSEHGLGMAVFLSHASLERLGGKLSLTNHVDGGALVTLSLPLCKEKESK